MRMPGGPTRRGVVRWLGVGALAPLAAACVGREQGKVAARRGVARDGFYGPLSPTLPLDSDALRVARADAPEASAYDLRGRPLLALPAGFRYRVVSGAGMAMDDGGRVPAEHDGMAAFAGPEPGTTLLVRNHELQRGETHHGNASGVVVPAALKWDPAAIGGTTTLLIGRDGRLRGHRASLGGTENNCAGGPTPWGSWLSCEESVETPEGSGGRFERRHGYVFEVPASAPGPVAARPIVAMGRCRREAAAVDPATGAVYLSEDRPDGCLYRYLPTEPGRLHAGGRLQALRLRDAGRSTDTSRGLGAERGRWLAVDWVTLDDVDPAADTLRREAHAIGAARFARGDGLWSAGSARAPRIVLACTTGGDLGAGQVFELDPTADRLTLLIESTDRDALDRPDNVTVGPDGRLLLCEDGAGGNSLIAVGADGVPAPMARNLLNDSELCGACSSPDGRFLFVNLQRPGLTFVIEGPWRAAG